ncbi:hypothetical protein Drorol1_Dr00024660 [Drosera rotundifolia]
MEYINPEAQAHSAQIHIYTKPSLIKDIISLLTKVNELQEYKVSCFGNFINFDTDALASGTLIHWLLSREIKVQDSQPLELWFGIGNKKARFSKYEFCLITGLKFGDNEYPLPDVAKELESEGILERYFHGQNMTSTELATYFNNRQHFEHPMDALKMALVLFVSGVLLGNDYKVKVPAFLWELVEDLDRFNDFEWGKDGYTMLYHNLHERQIGLKAGEKHRARYHVYGFTHAFQIWAYEAIPQIGQRLGEKYKSNEIPRFLNWKLPRRAAPLSGVDLETVLKRLKATTDETEQWYWVRIHDNPKQGFNYITHENFHLDPSNPAVIK